jgi:hypothetical protein
MCVYVTVCVNLYVCVNVCVCVCLCTYNQSVHCLLAGTSSGTHTHCAQPCIRTHTAHNHVSVRQAFGEKFAICFNLGQMSVWQCMH